MRSVTHLHIDFETRSTVDLKKTGVEIYAEAPDTGIWCLAWAIDDGPVEVIKHEDIGELPDALVAAVTNPKTLIFAHNANFELAIWNRLAVPRYGWPVLPVEQVRDTMAMCYAMALPGSLSGAAEALKLALEKDAEGHGLMMRMMKPRAIAADGEITWWDVEERKERLYEYCKRDVEVERLLHKKLYDLPPSEQALWQLDYKINQRGVPIDLDSVREALVIEDAVRKELNNELRHLTHGIVPGASSLIPFLGWVNAKLPEDQHLKSLDKEAVKAALDTSLPAEVRRALKIRQMLAKSSTKKLTAMRACTMPDGRARGLHQYHAATTGRWGGRRIQTQNLPRPKLKQETLDHFFDILDNKALADRHILIDNIIGEPISVLSDALRGFIAAPKGRTLMAADFANIEGRVLAWLAGQEDKLEAFRAFDRGEGPDLYIVAAAGILGKHHSEITPIERQKEGKTSELAFGFQGGVNAWEKFSPGTHSEDEINAIKDAWRAKHPNIVDFWHALDRAARKAVATQDKVFEAGHIKFRSSGSFLFCQLPSRRVLAYAFPRMGKKLMPWGEESSVIQFMTVDSVTNRWVQSDTYGGKLSENVTQAVARDVLAEAMIRLDNHGFEVCMHVHDEVVVEADDATRFEEFLAVMSETPAWADGLPVAVAGWSGRRFRK